MLSFITIDFDNKNHEKKILTLSKRNKFYLPELTLKFNKNLPISFVQERLRNLEKIEENKNNPKYVGLVWCGELIILDNKVIGFCIQQESIKELSIAFLLIDKKYQNQNYGSTYIERLKSEIGDKYLTVVCEDEEKHKNFYKKLGFKSTYEWWMTLSDDISSDSLDNDTEKQAIKNEKIIYLVPLQRNFDQTADSITNTLLSYFKF